MGADTGQGRAGAVLTLGESLSGEWKAAGFASTPSAASEKALYFQDQGDSNGLSSTAIGAPGQISLWKGLFH